MALRERWCSQVPCSFRAGCTENSARECRDVTMSDRDDRAEFDEAKRTRSLALGEDRDLFEKGVDTLLAADRYGYAYLWSWMGVPIIQLPADVMATQEVIWTTKPDIIIETGVARGGSV